jgi:hypothetical protein
LPIAIRPPTPLVPTSWPDQEHPEQEETDRRHEPAKHVRKQPGPGSPEKVTPAWVNAGTRAASTRVVEKRDFRVEGSLYFPVMVVGPTTMSVSFCCLQQRLKFAVRNDIDRSPTGSADPG